MASTEKLVVSIVADLKNWGKTLKGAAATLRRWGASVVKILKTTTIAFAAFSGAVVAAGAALTALVNSITREGDLIAKTAKRLGMSAEDVSAFGFAAERSGANLQAMTTGLRTFARYADEAAQGTKEYLELFERLGVTLTDGSGHLRPLRELFLDTAEAIRLLGNDTERLAMAQQLLGRGGIMLLPLIKEGKAGIQGLLAEAQRVGAVITSEQARWSEIYQDALTDLRFAWRNLLRAFGMEFVPTMTRLVKSLMKGLKNFLILHRDLIVKAAQMIRDKVINYISDTIGTIVELDETATLDNLLRRVHVHLVGIVVTLQLISNLIRNAIGAFKLLIGYLDRVGKAIEAYRQWWGAWLAQGAAKGDKLSLQLLRMFGFDADLWADVARKFPKEIEAYWQEGPKNIWKALTTPTRTEQDAWRDLSAGMDRIAKIYNTALDKALAHDPSKARPILGGLKALLEEIRSAIISGRDELITDTKGGADDINAILDGLENQVKGVLGGLENQVKGVAATVKVSARQAANAVHSEISSALAEARNLTAQATRLEHEAAGVVTGRRELAARGELGRAYTRQVYGRTGAPLFAVTAFTGEEAAKRRKAALLQQAAILRRRAAESATLVATLRQKLDSLTLSGFPGWLDGVRRKAGEAADQLQRFARGVSAAATSQHRVVGQGLIGPTGIAAGGPPTRGERYKLMSTAAAASRGYGITQNVTVAPQFQIEGLLDKRLFYGQIVPLIRKALLEGLLPIRTPQTVR